MPSFHKWLKIKPRVVFTFFDQEVTTGIFGPKIRLQDWALCPYLREALFTYEHSKIRYR